MTKSTNAATGDWDEHFVFNNNDHHAVQSFGIRAIGSVGWGGLLLLFFVGYKLLYAPTTFIIAFKASLFLHFNFQSVSHITPIYLPQSGSAISS